MKRIYQLISTIFLSLTLSLGLIIAPVQATGVYDLPIVSAGESVWIIDQAEVLSKATEGQLNNTLANLAQNTGYEVRMVTIRRLDYGQTIEGLVNELFTTWFPTSPEQANQTLIVLDSLTNKAALRTGEQVQQLLPLETANSITEETILFDLKELQYNQALSSASDRLVAILSGEEDPGPPQLQEMNIEGTYATAEETNDRSATIWVIVLLIVATVIPMVTYFWYVGFPGN
jgi:uncharacterized protein